jgi:glucose-6-phosphate isomerase/transaldolase/glucose-6-phosphate isomerase
MDQAGISYFLGPYQSAHENALQKMRRNSIAARIWANDFNVWKPSPHEITNRLGWLSAPSETLGNLHHIRSILQPLTSDGLSDVVLLGMGGSSLAADVFNRIFGSAPGFPKLQILDTTDPAVILETADRLDPKKALFLVSSKSGTTLEVVSLFHYFYQLTERKLGAQAAEHFIVITDEGSPMLETAWQHKLRYVFVNNPNIGGRYSALSLPGIVPAAMIGVDIEKLLHNAVAAARQEKADFFSGGNDSEGFRLGAALGVLAQYGRDKLTLILPPQWIAFGDWLEQLIAESTGKEGKGIVPVVSEPQPDAGVYGKDRAFVVFDNGSALWETRIADVASAGHPILKIRIDDAYDLGRQMFLWEMATAVASHWMGIHPFDQPDVEATKIHTRQSIEQFKINRTWPGEKPAITTGNADVYGDIAGATPDEALVNFLSEGQPGAYAALLVYLSPSDPIDQALSCLRKALIRKFKMAVTIGYGPRYLHSTGQLHKGDAGHGLFIVLTDDIKKDAGIPDVFGKPESSMTFGELKTAQGAGEIKALREKGRRVIRVHFKSDAAAELAGLASRL